MLAELYLRYLSYIIKANSDCWTEAETLRMGLEDTFIEYPQLRAIIIGDDFSVHGTVGDAPEDHAALKAMVCAMLQLLEMYIDESEARARFASQSKSFFEENYEMNTTCISSYLPDAIRDALAGITPKRREQEKNEEHNRETILAPEAKGTNGEIAPNALENDETFENISQIAEKMNIEMPKELIDELGLDAHGISLSKNEHAVEGTPQMKCQDENVENAKVDIEEKILNGDNKSEKLDVLDENNVPMKENAESMKISENVIKQSNDTELTHENVHVAAFIEKTNENTGQNAEQNAENHEASKPNEARVTIDRDALPLSEWVRALEPAGALDGIDALPQYLAEVLSIGMLECKIKYWSDKGLSADRLRNLSDQPPERISRGISIFERDAVKLTMIRSFLDNVDPTGIEADCVSLSSKLDDVIKTFVAEAEFERFLDKLHERDIKRLEEEIIASVPSVYLDEKMKFWRARGYDVAVLDTLSGLELHLMLEGIEEYERGICALAKFTEEFASIDTFTIEGEATRVQRMLKDVRFIGELPDALARLRESAYEAEKVREKLAASEESMMGICPMCGAPVRRLAFACPVCRFNAFREFTGVVRSKEASTEFEKEMQAELRNRGELYRRIAIWTGKDMPYSPNVTSSELSSKFESIKAAIDSMLWQLSRENAYSRSLGKTMVDQGGIVEAALDARSAEVVEGMRIRAEALKSELLEKRCKALSDARERAMLERMVSDLLGLGYNVNSFLEYSTSVSPKSARTLILELDRTCALMRARECEVCAIEGWLKAQALAAGELRTGERAQTRVRPSSIAGMLEDIARIKALSRDLRAMDELSKWRDKLLADICESAKEWEEERARAERERAAKPNTSPKPEAIPAQQSVSAVEIEEFRSRLRDKIFEYESNGYVVDRLDEALVLGIDEMKSALEAFEEGARHIERVKDRLAKLDIVGFEEYADALITRLTDVSCAEEAEKMLDVLEEKISERAKGKNETSNARPAGKDTRKEKDRKKLNMPGKLDGKKFLALAMKTKK